MVYKLRLYIFWHFLVMNRNMIARAVLEHQDSKFFMSRGSWQNVRIELLSTAAPKHEKVIWTAVDRSWSSIYAAPDYWLCSSYHHASYSSRKPNTHLEAGRAPQWRSTRDAPVNEDSKSIREFPSTASKIESEASHIQPISLMPTCEKRSLGAYVAE